MGPGKALSEVFDMVHLRGKHVLVDEVLPANCDFFISEIAKTFGYSLLTYSNTSRHFRDCYSQWGLESDVASVYESEERSADMVDDIRMREVHGRATYRPLVAVYRSNTSTEDDYYGYEVIVRVEGLRSGCSELIDGVVTIFTREQTIGTFRYKIGHSGQVYYFS